YWQNVAKPDFPIVSLNPPPKHGQSDWFFQAIPDTSTFLQTCEYRFYRLYPPHNEYPKVFQHNSGFQDDGIEASLKKYIRVVNPNSVNCYEQNCLSYFYVLCYPKIPRRCHWVCYMLPFQGDFPNASHWVMYIFPFQEKTVCSSITSTDNFHQNQFYIQPKIAHIRP